MRRIKSRMLSPQSDLRRLWRRLRALPGGPSPGGALPVHPRHGVQGVRRVLRLRLQRGDTPDHLRIQRRRQGAQVLLRGHERNQ